MNDKRAAVVKKAWQFLDKSGIRRVPFSQLCSLFQAQNHPRVLTREKKQETVYNELESCLGPRSQGGYITDAAFFEYYQDINATLPAEKDDYFVEMVLKSWGLNNEKALVSAQRLEEIENIVFEKVR